MYRRSVRDVLRERRPFLAVLLMLVLLLVVTGAEATPGQWVATGDMYLARYGHSATLLRDGRVLVAGGRSGGPSLVGAELYDPATGTWTVTGGLQTGRSRHTATLLPDGRVLVAGGTASGAPLGGAELYDPATGTWSVAATMNDARYDFGAVLLLDGRVLVAGGMGASGVLAGTEVYDPQADSWTPFPELHTARSKHTVTLLTTGHVLVAGGSDGAASLQSAERYHTASEEWIELLAYRNMTSAREGHTAVLLPDATVLVAGGDGLKSAELYQPSWPDPGNSEIEEVWYAAGVLSDTRVNHSATLLRNGQVLVAGGSAAGTLASVDLFDPTTKSWTPAAPMGTARRGHAATLLQDGRLLVSGGRDSQPLRSAELFEAVPGPWMLTEDIPSTLGRVYTAAQRQSAVTLANGSVLAFGQAPALYDPAGETWEPAAAMNFERRGGGTLLADGRVLVAGCTSGGPGESAELYDPLLDAWTMTGSMHVARCAEAVLLDDGRVLVAGGGIPFVNYDEVSAEIYDPASGTWTLTGAMSMVHGSDLTLLKDGRVLVIGGLNTSDHSGLKKAELYDPAAGTWSYTGDLNIGRYGPLSVLLPGGKVLALGGRAFDDEENKIVWIDTAELFDPDTGAWTALPGQHDARYAVLLHDGKVLAGSELYDPATGSWTGAGDRNAPCRSEHLTALLHEGRVLLAGGQHCRDPYPLWSAELFERTVVFIPAIAR